MKILFAIIGIAGSAKLIGKGIGTLTAGQYAGMTQTEIEETALLYIILGIIWGGVIFALYRLYESHSYKNTVKRIEAKAKAEGMTFEEYINSHVSQRCLEYCEHFKGNEIELIKWLNSCVENENLSKDLEKYLYKKYQ